MLKLKQTNDAIARQLVVVKSITNGQQIEFFDDGGCNLYTKKGKLIIKKLGAMRSYEPSPVTRDFIFNMHISAGIRGPVGSGKSVGMWHKLYRYACLHMPVYEDNTVRFKVIIVRNTFAELISTTILTWYQWFGQLGSISGANAPYLHRQQIFYYQGKRIIFEIAGFGLDKPAQFDKLKSFEATAAYLNELRALPRGIFDVVRERLRWPATGSVAPYTPLMIFDTNGIRSKNHWYYKFFEQEQHDDFMEFVQPPACLWSGEEWEINPQAENLDIVGVDYYTRLFSGKPANDEYVLRELCAEYGCAAVGKLVHSGFRSHVHAEDCVSYVEGEHVYLGFDVGLAPAGVLCQVINGRLRVFKEFTPDFGKGVVHICENVMKPYLAQKNIPLSDVTLIYDQSNARDGNFAKTPVDILSKYFTNCIPNATQNITYRLEAVNTWLNRMVDGQSGLVIDRHNCPELYAGFTSDYVYTQAKDIKNGDIILKEIPVKTHPISDVQDALQNVAMHILNGQGQSHKVKKIFSQRRRA